MMKNMSKKEFDVIVVGELNVDLILNKIESFPEIGKEKISEEMTLTLGSSSAIFACNLRALGARVSFVGKVGTDYFGDLVIDQLNAKGVDTSMLIRDKNIMTGATVVLNFSEDRAMVTHPGAMNYLTIENIDPEIIDRASHLHFSSFFLQNGLRNDVHMMFKMAKEMGLTTSFDMQWDPAERWNMDYSSILPYVDVFLPNEKELLYLSRENDISRGLEKLAAYSKNIIVKMGNNGSLSYGNGKSVRINAFLNKNVVDAIGAGDSFNAGFVFKYIQGEKIPVCQEFGNLMGAVNTTAAGGTTAFGSYDMIKQTAKEKFGIALQ